MKKNIVFILVLFSTIAFPHSGRTDRNGGHYNRSTGEYHYHNGSGTLGKIVGGGLVLFLLFASGKKNKK